MKRVIGLFSAFILLLSFEAHSRDTTHFLPIESALQSADFKKHLDPNIALYFADQSHPKVAKKISDAVTNKKTNAFGKSDETACQWVFLSALKQLQAKAREVGGNAVINIESYYKRNVYSSNQNYECHAGAIMAGVALRGKVVTVKK